MYILFYRVPPRSSKVAAPTQPIGTLVQDRETSIAGIIGKHPGYIPVNLNIQTTDGKRHHKSYEVIRDRGISGLYAGIGASYLLDALEFLFPRSYGQPRGDYRLERASRLGNP